MSWITNLTEKAENILNKIDGNAAQVLNQNKLMKATDHNTKDTLNDRVVETEVFDGIRPAKNKSYSSSPMRLRDINHEDSINVPSGSIKNQIDNSDLLVSKLANVESNTQIEMLHNEIRSLNREITSLVHRSRVAERESMELRESLRISEYRNSALQDELQKLLLHENDQKDDEPTFLHKQLELMRSELKAKETEVLKLKGEAKDKVMTGAEESRIHALTVTLLEKQTHLELAKAENNALLLELQQLKDELSRSGINRLSSIIRMNDTDDAKAQIPTLVRESPFDTIVTRRVKRAYKSIDSRLIKTGIFLKNYPFFRLSLLGYVVVMHLWILMILFSHVPDKGSTTNENLPKVP